MRVVSRWIQVFGMAAALGLVVSAPAQATPIVTATVTPTGSLFHYDYSITFDPLDDLVAVLSVFVLPGDSNIDATLVSPSGFLASYDIGLGILDFLPVLNFPTSGALSGFAFDSARRVAGTSFEALTISADTLTGPTTGPLGPASPIPEPATGVLLAAGLAGLARRLTRRTQSNRRLQP